MAAAGPVLSMVGAGVKAGAANQEGNAKAQAANMNAYVANINADQAISQSAEEERMQRASSATQIGQERANYGSSGVSSSSGSALDVLALSAQNAELDALNIRHSGQMKAWSYQMGASQDVVNAANAHIAANYGVASALIEGVKGATGGMGGSSSPSGGGD